MPRSRLVPLCVATLAATFGVFPVRAAARSWNAGSGNWSLATNWAPVGVPTQSEPVNINTIGNGRTITYDVSAPDLGLLTIDHNGPGTTILSMPGNNSLTALGIYVGGFSGATGLPTDDRGTLNQSAGTTTISFNRDLVVGHGAGSTGIYTLSGGALIANQSEFVGLSGTGTFTHTAGSNTINASAVGSFSVGTLANSTGTYNLGGTGALLSDASEYIGDIGTGVLNQTGGTNTISGAGNGLYLGYNAGGTGGTYSLIAGDLRVSTGAEIIGYNGSGSFNQSGGTNTADLLFLGRNSTSATGTYTLSGGTLTAFDLHVGYQGIGIFNQTGGINNTSQLEVGNQPGSTGTYSLSAGDLQISGRESIGSGSFNQSGGTHTVDLLFLDSISTSATSTYTLSGGTLTSSNLQVGYQSRGTFNQTGGINNAGQLYVGNQPGSTGSYMLSGGSASADYLQVGSTPGGILMVSGTGVLTIGGLLDVYNTAGSLVNLNGGTINAARLHFEVPALFNWTSGKLNLTTSVMWDPTANPLNSTGAAFGAALALGGNRTLMVTGDETLGGVGAFALTLNSGSTHHVTGTLTVGPTGTLTLNTGSTLSYSTFTQAGGTVNGTLLNQTNFIYQSGQFNGRLLNQGATSISGPSFTAGNGVQNDSSMTINVGQTLTVNGQGLDNQGSFSLAGGTVGGAGPLVNNSVLSGRGTLAGTGGFTNNGLVTVSGGTLTLSNSGTNANSGQIDIPGGQQLRLTGAALANAGVINLSGGTIGGPATLNNSTGIISGHGTISSPLVNAGSLAVDGGILSVTSSVTAPFTNTGEIFLAGGLSTLGGGGPMTNTGLIRGDGVVSKAVNNNAGGEIRAEGGKRINLTGASGANAGLISLQGGALEFKQPLFNSGNISGRGTLFFDGGLTNFGKMQFSGGPTDIYGNVTFPIGAGGTAAGVMINSGSANVVTFYGNVTHNGDEIRTSPTNTTVFFGNVTGAGPFTGTGAVRFEGTFMPGNSPAAVAIEGDMQLSADALLVMELGGTVAGAQHDQLVVGGIASLDGTLDVSLIDGFAPRYGDSFDLFDFGALTGGFDVLHLPDLDGHIAWDTTALYQTGSISVVPEPTFSVVILFAMIAMDRRRNATAINKESKVRHDQL